MGEFSITLWIYFSRLLDLAQLLDENITVISPIQLEAIKLINHFKNLVLRVPTGSGKTLCFTIPFLVRSQCLVIILYPLISLLNDMFNRLKNRVHVLNIREEIISKETMIELLQRVYNGDCFFLIGTHESFLKQIILHNVIRHLHKRHLCFVFDEAHTIPTWGLDFRRRLIDVCLKISEAPNFQLILSSATISNEDISFICNIQKLREIHLISKVQIRNELQYKIYDVSIIDINLVSLKGIEKEVPAFIRFLKTLLSENNSGIIFLDNIKRLMYPTSYPTWTLRNTRLHLI